ncbi:MAG: nuclease-related domain-containing protein [Solirubrobacterales bacterium]
MATASDNAATARRERTGSFGVFASRVRGEAQHDAEWRSGATDHEVAAELEYRTADENVLWLHGRTRPGTVHATIDHIAVGPGGVTVISSKDLSGKVRVNNAGGMFGPRMDMLTVNSRDHNALVRAIEQQVEAVKDVLALRGLPHIEVRGAICISNGDGLPLFRRLKVRGVPIDDAKGVAAVTTREGSLNSETVAVANAHLASALPAL